MSVTWIKAWRTPLRALRAVATPGLVLLGGSLLAADRPLPPLSTSVPATLPPAITAPAVVEAVHPADLASARAAALGNQPSVKAANSSLQAAIQRRHAIVSLRVPTILAKDLPVRKQQAELGVSVGEAGVHLAQLNAKYAAEFGYLTFLYAKEQERVVEDALDRLEKSKETLSPDEQQKKEMAEREAKGEAEKIDALNKRLDLVRVESFLGVAKSKQAEAKIGAERAASVLREAMGHCPEAVLRIDRTVLPEVCLALDKKTLIALALARRPEIVQASAGVEAGSLEVEAQAATRRLQFRVGTYAQGSDLHATPLPSGSFDNSYAPAAVGPDMPVTINGKRGDRVAVAEAYAGRAGDLLSRTKALIVLETEQAFLRWVEASKRVDGLREAVRKAVERAETYAFISDKGKKNQLAEEVDYVEFTKYSVEAGNTAAQVRADLNKARYELLLALAQLERATAGGFCAKIEAAPDRPDDVAAARERIRPGLQRLLKKDGKQK